MADWFKSRPILINYTAFSYEAVVELSEEVTEVGFSEITAGVWGS